MVRYAEPKVNPEYMEKQRYTAKIIEHYLLTPDVIQFRTEIPTGFVYAAGQFVQFLVPAEDKEVARSYSISSKPSDPYLEFCVKVIPGGVASPYLAAKTQGDELTFTGPNGVYVNKSDDQTLTFIATGVGLAPNIGIIEDELLVKRNNNKIHCLFGVRHEIDIFWIERLETLARDYDNFSYTLTLSQPSDTWGSEKGRVTAHLETLDMESSFFICGNLDMIKDVRMHLMKQKVGPKNIHFEIFH